MSTAGPMSNAGTLSATDREVAGVDGHGGVRVGLVADSREMFHLHVGRGARSRRATACPGGAAEVDGDQLSDAELGMFLVQLLVTGSETTAT
jgi:hypothetical protein